ncbi:hypothetical protein D6C97_05019 [Aureobasidium pullulans]|nr:hypothetical protein D6C97_05019 [Aureobasidium pullulans]CAD0015495.1 unnamed protein product [Aureobasidium pullulans]
MARLSGSTQPAGLGKTATGLGGKGLGKSTAKRHRKILRDNINGITKGSISFSMTSALSWVLTAASFCLLSPTSRTECTVRKTITVPDVVFVLNCHGTPIYGFDTPFRTRK